MKKEIVNRTFDGRIRRKAYDKDGANIVRPKQ
jgi:hypothetical protein